MKTESVSATASLDSCSSKMFSFGLLDFQAPKKAPPATSVPMDEDAQKRNTDCIYFLASPLTCKKGNNCEYRHSEAARTNPRDCRYWKSGNCLNAHCSFRHLPLEVKPGSAISTGTTMPQTHGAGSSKSKTPCYFFSQGYCAKSDTCTFLHSLPTASSPAESPSDQSPLSAVKGKTLHTNGRPLIVLKQSGLISEEGRPVTIGTSEALNKANFFSSRASVTVQGVPENVEISVPFRHDNESEKSGGEPDRFCDVPYLVNGSKQRNVTKKILQGQDNGQRITKTDGLINKNGFQSKALWKDVPSGNGLHQAPGGRKGVYSLISDSRKSSQGLSKSPACDGQYSDDVLGDCKGQREESDGDLRNQLTKRMKINSSLYSSTGKGGHPGLASQQRGSGKRHDDHPKQKKQQQGGNNRNKAVETGFDVVKGVKFSKGGSSYLPPKAPKQSFIKVQSRRLAGKQPVVDDNKALPILETRIQASSGLTSKSATSENVKETLNFTGPKSLAQIKAEKMAARESTSKATESLDSSSVMSESGSKLGSRTSAVPANSVASNHKLDRLSASIIEKDNGLKHEAATSEGSEGQINALSKRKREVELGTAKMETMQGPIAVQVSALTSCSEVEDGEFCVDDICRVDDLHDDCTLVPSDEVFEVPSPSNVKDEVSGGLQSSSEEALEFEADSSEDGSKLDLEMEDTAHAVEDYEIDDDDDDDFAKELGRFFDLSNE